MEIYQLLQNISERLLAKSRKIDYAIDEIHASIINFILRKNNKSYCMIT